MLDGGHKNLKQELEIDLPLCRTPIGTGGCWCIIVESQSWEEIPNRMNQGRKSQSTSSVWSKQRARSTEERYMPKSEHPHFEKPKNKCLNEREKHSWQQGMKKKTADEETEIEFTYSSKQRVIKMKTQNQSQPLTCYHWGESSELMIESRNEQNLSKRKKLCLIPPWCCSLDFVQSVALFSSAFPTSPPPSLLQNSISRCISEALRPERSSSLCVYYSFLLRKERSGIKKEGMSGKREKKKKRKREKRKAPCHLQLHHRSMELAVRKRKWLESDK